MARTRTPQAMPLREELEALADAYHHLHNEVERAPKESSRRRELEERLLRVHKRFERMLEEWVQDDDVRRRWHEHLHTHAPLPDEPRAIEPVVFRGESDAGSFCEVRRRAADELEVWVDGALLARVGADDDLRSRKSGLRFRVDSFEFAEIFRASLPAIEALEAFRERGGEPPWEYALELLEDGLIDSHYGVTPRGHRAIAEPPPG